MDKYSKLSFGDRLEKVCGDVYKRVQYDHSNLYYACKGIAESIAEQVNHGSPDQVAQVLVYHLLNQHRTLQAQSVAAVIKALNYYAEAPYDPRNASAVHAAGKIKALDDNHELGIPLI